MSVQADAPAGGPAPLVDEAAGEVVPLGRRTAGGPDPATSSPFDSAAFATGAGTVPQVLSLRAPWRAVALVAPLVMAALLLIALLLITLLPSGRPPARQLELSGFVAPVADVSAGVGERLSGADRELRHIALERRRAARRRAEQRAARRARAERQRRAARARAREHAAAPPALPGAHRPESPRPTPAPKAPRVVAPEFDF